MITINGVLKKGYGIASGRAENSPYPAASITMQTPFFLKRGLDIRHCFAGTLNISIHPKKFLMIHPAWTFEQVKWFSTSCETFSFSPCSVIYKKKEVEGYIYYPHPETKPDHFQDESTLEVLAPYLGELIEGAKLTLNINEKEIEIVSHC